LVFKLTYIVNFSLYNVGPLLFKNIYKSFFKEVFKRIDVDVDDYLEAGLVWIYYRTKLGLESPFLYILNIFKGKKDRIRGKRQEFFSINGFADQAFPQAFF
jgi:hypothetical protein